MISGSLWTMGLSCSMASEYTSVPGTAAQLTRISVWGACASHNGTILLTRGL